MPDDTTVAEADRRQPLRPAPSHRRSRPLTKSTPAAVRSRGHRLRLAGLVAAAFVLITAPNVFAANATNINIQLPAGLLDRRHHPRLGRGRPGGRRRLRHRDRRRTDTRTTDATGKYKIIGLAPGSYTIQVSAPSRQEPRRRLLHDREHQPLHGGLPPSATKVTVSPNKTGIDVKLPAGFTVTGTVTTTAGAPSRVPIVSAIGPSYDGAYTDATGKFTLIGLPRRLVQAGGVGPGRHELPARLLHDRQHQPLRRGVDVGDSLHPRAEQDRGDDQGADRLLDQRQGHEHDRHRAPVRGRLRVVVDVLPTRRAPMCRATTRSRASRPARTSCNISPGANTSYKYGYYTQPNADHFTGAAASATTIAVGPSEDRGQHQGRDRLRDLGHDRPRPRERRSQDAYVTADNLGHSRSASTDATGKYTIKGLTGGAQKLSIRRRSTSPTLQQDGLLHHQQHQPLHRGASRTPRP